MSTSSPDSSWGLRKKHRRAPSLFTDLNPPAVSHDLDPRSAPAPVNAHKTRRPSLKIGSIKRPPSSVFGSLKSSVRSSSDEKSGDATGDMISTPSSATSFGFGDGNMDGQTPSRTVLLHGEVQTSAGMFRKKKEYLVLTETHVIRYKSQVRAAETFKVVPYPSGKPQGPKHGSVPSAGSQSDLQTLSDSSGDKDGRVPLRQVVAVHRLDDGKPYFAIEVCYLDEESAQSSAVTLQYSNPEERDVWLKNIRNSSGDARLREQNTISAFNLENAARIIERDHDYDPANCAIYKAVQRQSASKSNRTSSDDLTKVASTVCFFAIGVHKVHIIQVAKAGSRSSSPSLGPNSSQASYGILNLTSVKVSETDDTFELTFRQPLQQSKHLYLASSASYEIAARLHFAENFLRPECGYRLYKFNVPPAVEDLIAPPVASDEEHSCLDRTLAAYCVAYGLNPSNVRYTINYNCEDAPRFELLPASDTRRPEYGPVALLAIMRALRYNESFGSLSFASMSLDGLNGLHDNHGQEYVVSRTKRGTAIKLSVEELGRACLLVQEIRALAATSKRLRRMDFSGCVSATISTEAMSTEQAFDDDGAKAKDIGCGIVEALFPLCRHQTTNVDWIILNGIHLSDTDLDYLVGAAVDKSCHIRAIELDRCGLNDRSMGLILDALRAQDNTLEAIEIAGNTARLDPSTFDSQLSMFGFIRKLNLSWVSRTSGSEPLLTAETLLVWRLQELRLSGTALNPATIDAVATYLAHPQSNTLHELYIDNAYLSGRDVATLLHSLTLDPGHPRDLHLDISHNLLIKGLEQVTKAIAEGYTPSHMSMRAIEYREESQFRKMLAALAVNKTIRSLDMSQTALPGDSSDDTCRALQRMLAENETLLDLDLSGEDSRLAVSRFGSGINDALAGLKQNKSIQSFRIEKQRLGLQGASTLAEVLKENTTLRELHCDRNEIPLHGLTDLVNSLIENTTLVYLPTMNDGREASFKSAEMTMKGISDRDPPPPPRTQAPRTNSFGTTAGMRKGLTSVRRSAARAASAYAPSFPALPSYSRTNSPSESRSFSLTMPVQRTRQNSQSPITAPVSFTVQDIQTTHRLLSEQWDRQCYRLAKYLERNWRLLNGAQVNMEVDDEKFERPESVGSLGKVLEQVKSDTTPRTEKELYFESTDEVPPIPAAGLTSDEKHTMSVKQFIVETGPTSQDSVDDTEQRARQLRIDTNFDYQEEPKTPTQGAFTS